MLRRRPTPRAWHRARRCGNLQRRGAGWYSINCTGCWAVRLESNLQGTTITTACRRRRGSEADAPGPSTKDQEPRTALVRRPLGAGAAAKVGLRWHHRCTLWGIDESEHINEDDRINRSRTHWQSGRTPGAKHGYNVVISNSRGPETLSSLVRELGPKARAATPAEAAEAGDIVVVTIPLKNYRTVPVAPLAGKIVIDTNNYYPERDGHIPELDNESTTTSELLQAHLPKSHVVKAFNHIYAAALTTDGQPSGTPNRRALAIFGDDATAKDTVADVINQFGFDVLDGGPLNESWRIQRDTPGTVPAGQRRNCVTTWRARVVTPTSDTYE